MAEDPPKNKSWREDLAEFLKAREKAAATNLEVESPALPRASLKRKQPHTTDSSAETDSSLENNEGFVKGTGKALVDGTTGVVIYGRGRNMFKGSRSNVRGKTFELQFVKTGTFCSRLDTANPNHNFTYEDYKHYWEIAVKKQWKNVSLELFDKWNPGLSDEARRAKLAEEKKNILNLIQDDSVKNHTKRPKTVQSSQEKKLRNRIDNARATMKEYGTPKVRDVLAMLEKYDGDMDFADMLEQEANAKNVYDIRDILDK